MCPSAFRVPPRPREVREPGSKLHQNFLGQVGMWVPNFIKIRSAQGFGFLLALHIQTDRKTNICTAIYIYIEDF